MPRGPRRRGPRAALEAARFGEARTLDLHEGLPTALEAADRAERWLRERQVHVGGEMLIITGRGAHSVDGISAVREAVRRRLAILRRAGVVAAVGEESAGAFRVTLAPVRAMLEAPRRRRGPGAPAAPAPPSLAALDTETIELLRRLAVRALDVLGMRDPGPRFIEEEMVRQFTRLVAPGAGRPLDERAFRTAIAAAIETYDDAG